MEVACEEKKETVPDVEVGWLMSLAGNGWSLGRRG